MRGKPLALAVVGVLLLSSSLTPRVFAQGGASRAATIDRLGKILRDVKAPKVTAGVAVGMAGEREPFFTHDATTPLTPASNEKILTTASAALLLGLDHEIRTEVIAHGDVSNGVLAGNLRVRGEGDPTFGAQDHGETLAKLEFFADRLRAQGLTQVAGDLLVDDSAFDQDFVGPDWPTSDPRTTPYLAQVAALSLDDGCARVVVTPGGVGKTPALSVVPDVGHITLKNSLSTTDGKKPAGFRFDRDEGSNQVTAVGAVRRGGSTTSHFVAVHDPALHFGRGFRQALEHRGITVKGEVRRSKPEERTGGTVLIRYGTPLSRIFPYLLKESQNHRAEMVFKHLGFATGNTGSFAGGGAAVDRALEKIGVPREGLVVADGSGLSRKNRMTARALFGVLSEISKTDAGEAYRESLAEPGESGTLEKRLTALAGRLFAKTGTLNGVSTLSGYVLSAGGRWVAFAALMNGTENRAVMKKLQDEVVEALAAMNGDA